jgi:hypothetical protein
MERLPVDRARAFATPITVNHGSHIRLWPGCPRLMTAARSAAPRRLAAMPYNPGGSVIRNEARAAIASY